MTSDGSGANGSASGMLQAMIETDKAANDLTEITLRQVDGERRGVFTWAPPAPNLFPKLDACPSAKAANASREGNPKQTSSKVAIRTAPNQK